MVKHIVMFKLTEKTSENMELATDSLRSLENKIETLKSIEIGTDFLESDRSYDIVLTAHFENQEGLKTYSSHENHLPVVKIMRSLCSSSVVVDYEL
ncbi:MAG: Dabb family protein [Nitrospinales bacterium]|nr:Dabb family protein [Nitrospinales bacterium]